MPVVDVLVPVFVLPKPMIFPPAVDVVRNQASMLKTPGACSESLRAAAAPVDVPWNVDAVFGSPEIAPPAPRVTPAPRVRSLPADVGEGGGAGRLAQRPVVRRTVRGDPVST